MIPRLAVTIHLTSKVGSSCRAAATSEGTSGKREERSRRPYRSVLVSLVPHSFPSSITPGRVPSRRDRPSADPTGGNGMGWE